MITMPGGAAWALITAVRHLGVAEQIRNVRPRRPGPRPDHRMDDQPV